MNIQMNYNNTNFKSKYQVNRNEMLANHNKLSDERDFIFGYWDGKARNGEQLHQEWHDFLFGVYKQKPQTDCYQIYDIDDKYDAEFEKSMNAVGQSFKKLA